MTRTYNLNSAQTLEQITQLFNDGITNISVMIRHSERHFSDVSGSEPFMGLTDKGKDYAYEFGTQMPQTPTPTLVSSFFGRCIETAYLIDKGFTRKYNTPLAHTDLETLLSPFYITDPDAAIPLLLDMGSDTFLRQWFDKKIDKQIMACPEATTQTLCRLMIDQIKTQSGPGLTICVSHDWNIYPIREFKLNIPHETSDDVGYLDAMIFYRKDDQYYLTSRLSDPVLLDKTD
jgi:hypothetical protein